MNISGLDNVSSYTKLGNINYQAKSEDSRTDVVVGAFADVFFGNKPMNSTDVSGLGISERAAMVEEALKGDAKVAKENLKALFNKLSGSEAAVMEDGKWEINDLEPEEVLTVVDRIKIMLATYCEDYQPYGMNVNSEEIEKAVGSKAMASKIIEKFKANYIPPTKENAMEVVNSLDIAQKLKGTLEDNAKVYILNGNMEPTLENIYKAEHLAGVNNQVEITPDTFEQLRPQIDKVIEEAGYEKNQQSYDMAKWMLKYGLPLTTESFTKLGELNKYTYVYDEDDLIDRCVNAMADGKKAKDALITGDDKSQWKDAIEAAKIINAADEKDVERVTAQYGVVTIARLSMSMTSIEGYMAANYSTQVSQAIITNNIALNEARLMLTAYSGRVLMNSGLDIFNTDIRTIVDMLHEEQTKYVIDDLSNNNAGSISEEDIKRVAGFNDNLINLMYMPSAAIGAVMSQRITTRVVVSISEIRREGSNLKERYEQAGQAYDTISTKVRTDMGDNLSKAVKASAENILNELGLENTKQNIRSVKILASNTIEMTEENIYEASRIDVMLNDIIDNISPRTVLDMLREGINPMEADIQTLHQYMEEKQSSVTKDIEKYSEFLYELDQNNKITSEEREEFIGVYKLFNMFKKDGGKAIGALMNQDAELTIGNLLMAINSRKQYGMDVTLTQDAGMAEVTGKVAYFNTLFGALSNKITSQLLDGEDKNDINNMTLEQLADMEIDSMASMDIRSQYYAKELERMEDFVEDEDYIIRKLTDYQLPITFHNLMAAEGMTKKAAYTFGKAMEEDSQLEADINELVDNLTDAQNAKNAYEKLNKDTNTAIRNMLTNNAAGNLDLNSLRYLSESTRLMKELTGRQDYIIPFKTEEGIATINLKLLKSDENSGSFTLNMDTGNTHKLYLEGKVTGNTLSIFVLKDDAKEYFDEQFNEKIYEELKQVGYEEIKLNSMESKAIPTVSGKNSDEQVATAKLYRTAKVIVKNVINR